MKIFLAGRHRRLQSCAAPAPPPGHNSAAAFWQALRRRSLAGGARCQRCSYTRCCIPVAKTHACACTCARSAYLSTWSRPRCVRTVITSTRYAHCGMHAFTATWTHERRIAVWSNGVREGTAAMRLRTRAVVYVSLRVTAVALDAIAPTKLLFKRARTPAHANSCEFVLRASTLEWIGRWSATRALVTLCRRLRRY